MSTVQSAILDPESNKIVRAAPRGNAKSTHASLLLVLWCALFEHKRYIMLLSDTASQANDFLSAVKSELEDNPLLINDFGIQQGLIWTASDIILRSNIRIQAVGAGKKIRGRRFKQYRPDLIIGDDLENDENVESPDQRKKMFNWWMKAVSKAGAKGTDFVVIGTIIHYDSLLAKLLKNPIYDTKKYRSILNWSASPKWEEWTRLVTNLEDKDRANTAKTYFEQNKQEMLEGTRVLWEEVEDYYFLMLQLIADGPAAFSSEKQNEPIADEDRRFDPEWIKYYDDSDLIGKDLHIVGFVDPSLGKKGGDYSAIITLGADANNQVYVLDCTMRKMHPDDIIETAVNLHRSYRYKVFGTELVAFQEYFKDNLKKRLEQLEQEDITLALTVRGVKVHSDKILRIESLQPDVKSGRIRFRRDQQSLIEQLVNFPSADHDDGPDALHGAMQMFGRRSALADYYRNLADESKKSNLQSILQNPNRQKLG